MFCNACSDFMGESELETFVTGFRLGARFALDTFLRGDLPAGNEKRFKRPDLRSRESGLSL